ncbi:acyl-CoA dehydrogenase family protein [Pararhizobium arenae]|uniref:acyl-CoA dehydrogenase family protein n=1 Tax=Pararhizobium arenae TaxID=1856850 RepID=UPI00094B0A79|nr:acyl-CoA dehydrogenase family protein [Pararhizobium arenae]
MQSSGLAPGLIELQTTAASIAQQYLAPDAERIDGECVWPDKGMTALARAGLTGLHMPRRVGGAEEGLLALAVVTEELGAACSSTAMCFGMHSVAAKVLAAKATPDQEERFLLPIARGEHITSLALSEASTGVHFFLPGSHFRPDGNSFVISGDKSFVTSGGYADSYVVSAVTPGSELDPGSFSCLVVEANAPGLEWREPWQGYGMRGNSSRPVFLNDVVVPKSNLLGAEGDQIWYVFEVVAPYFLIAMAGVYLGISRAALQLAIDHLRTRSHSHTGETLSEVPALWHQVAEAWTDVEATRQLVRSAASNADAGAPDAALGLFAAKSRVAQTVTSVTETAMILMGGRGYADKSRITRLHRDARAAHVMAPTTHLLQTWLGRSLLGLPLL